MKNLAMIACIGRDGGLGKNNDLLWRFSEDQKFFRNTTMDSIIVMGRKTFISIGRALPGRENLVLSRSNISAPDVTVFHDKTELDQYLKSIDSQKFIIGGASLYEMYLSEAETIYLTEVNAEKPADVFFPSFDRSNYNAEILQTGETDGVSYRIVKYSRKEEVQNAI